MFDGDNGNHDLLRHCPTVNEACATDKVKEVGSLGNPELHVALGPGSHAQLATPCRIVISQIRAKQVTLLCQDRAVGLFFQFALCPFQHERFP